jgi:hypothetical protein
LIILLLILSILDFFTKPPTGGFIAGLPDAASILAIVVARVSVNLGITQETLDS